MMVDHLQSKETASESPQSSSSINSVICDPQILLGWADTAAMPGSLAQTQNMGSAQSKNPRRTKCKCGKGDTGNPDCVKATQEGPLALESAGL